MRTFKTALSILCVVLIGCSGSKEVATEKMAIGWVDRTVFAEPEHEAFKTTFDTVQVDEQFVGLISEIKGDVDYTVFFGSWCKDSKRELPHFLKVADKAGIHPEKIKLYGVDRTKKSADGLTEKYHIERVPTIIFLKDGTEIGRITETPQTTIEGDMVTILASVQGK